MSQPTSALNTPTNILTSPILAFRELNSRPTLLFPLLALLAANIVLMMCFFACVDFEWLIEQMVNPQTLDKSATERADMKNAMSGLTPLIMGGSAMVGVLFLYRLGCLYCVGGHGQGYR